MGISKREYVIQMEKYKTSLYQVAYSYMKNRTHALDALDEALYKGYINRHKLKKEECFKVWITRIVVNECLQLLRKNKRELLLEQLPEEATEAFDSLPVRDALDKLSQELASIIYLRFFGGYTLAETSTILNVPQGTVATRERKALALLKIELS